MKRHNLLLEKHSGRRPGRTHDGKVAMIRSNLRWCSDGFEFACWNGEIIRAAFVIDAHDREVIAWRAVSGCGIDGSQVRDMMLEAIEARFGTIRAPHPVEWLSDNGSPYTAKETRDFASQLNLVPCFTPVASPEFERYGGSLCANLQTRLSAHQPVAGGAYFGVFGGRFRSNPAGDFAAKRHPFAKDSRCPLRRTAADELILSSWFTESN